MSMSNLILVIDTTVVILGDQRDTTSGGPSENLKMIYSCTPQGKELMPELKKNIYLLLCFEYFYINQYPIIRPLTSSVSLNPTNTLWWQI